MSRHVAEPHGPGMWCRHIAYGGAAVALLRLCCAVTRRGVLFTRYHSINPLSAWGLGLRL